MFRWLKSKCKPRFDLRHVLHDRQCAEDFQNIADVLQRLTKSRKWKIEKVGQFAKSKLAWKVETYKESILHRTVALASGARTAWNGRNVLLSFLAVRALTETVAVFDNFEIELRNSLGREDLSELDKLSMNRIFATKDEILLGKHPELLAINVLTFIDKLDKRYGLGVRRHYDSMSERCHPNSAGHHQLYSATNYSDGTVTFSDTKNLEQALTFIRAPLGLLFIFERTITLVEELIPKVAELQHRLSPVR